MHDDADSSGVASASQTNPQAAGFDSGFLTGSARPLLSDLGIAIPPGNEELRASIDDPCATFVAWTCDNPTIAAVSTYFFPPPT